MVCRNERGASKSARNHGKTMSFEMVFDGCWDGLTVEYRPPTALSEQICRSLQRATIIYAHIPQNVRTVFPLWRWYPQAIIVAFLFFFILNRLTLFFSAWLAVFTRWRLLITSVLRLIGLGVPWSFKKRPQALHRTEPISSLRHSGVVEVAQFWHTGW